LLYRLEEPIRTHKRYTQTSKRPWRTIQKIDVKEAQARLSELIEQAARGEEVVILRGDGASFKIVPCLEAKPRPRFGSAKGFIEVADDFDEPLEDFEAYAR
jgi:antitoxin (DNA-binding transcriptional repressor) of toxin-antitoxin stability system